MILAPVKLGDLVWDWSRTCIVGVINITPDSFFDGGDYQDPTTAVAHGLHLASRGADVLDVGGESTRPGATPVDAEEEIARVIPVIEQLAQQCEKPISIDTVKAKVAQAAVAAGASIVNDISGMQLDGDMGATVAECGCTVILGHLRGRPATMQQDIHFEDVVAEVINELREVVQQAIHAGISAERIWVDPGIGFGKTAAQSIQLLKAAGQLRQAIGYPLMVGPSRKSFIGAVTGQPVHERLTGTCAAVAASIIAGADAVRIHDVEALIPAIRVADAIRRAGRSSGNQCIAPRASRRPED